MTWLKKYFDILRIKDFCLNYYCTTCGANPFKTGLIVGAIKSLKDDLGLKIKNSEDGFAIEPYWNALKENQKKIIFKEICEKLSNFTRKDIEKYNFSNGYSPVTFISLMSDELGLKEIFFNETRYSPVHQFKIDELKKMQEQRKQYYEEQKKAEARQQNLKIEKELKKAEENKKKIERKKIKDQERIKYLNHLNQLSLIEIFKEILHFEKFRIMGIKDIDLNIKFDDFRNTYNNLDKNDQDNLKKVFYENHAKFKNFKKLLKEI